MSAQIHALNPVTFLSPAALLDLETGDPFARIEARRHEHGSLLKMQSRVLVPVSPQAIAALIQSKSDVLHISGGLQTVSLTKRFTAFSENSPAISVGRMQLFLNRIAFDVRRNANHVVDYNWESPFENPAIWEILHLFSQIGFQIAGAKEAPVSGLLVEGFLFDGDRRRSILILNPAIARLWLD